ncbi:MutS-related protein [Actinocrispum wychmicini]|uniref:MutS-like protein n=1 Tax=Actinocrispum wychmicini TaxID=1213861 RepID=A0A4R2JNQ0_9PSEU|nr:DNA mismatch repair protein MutS [Actinocrispum wychmicini]TCO60964.1 MutS-like protein [Actinocrispum wychmicini]
MGIRSVLFGVSGPPVDLDTAAEPDHFRDLNLDHVVTAIVRANPDCRLAPYFHHPVRDADLVRFRQDVFRDLDDRDVLTVVERFAASMRTTRRRVELVARVTHPPQRDRWFLDIALAHLDMLTAFADGLDAVPIRSDGLRAVRDDVREHTRSPGFRSLRDRAERLRDRLAAVRYDMLLRDDKITVARHEAPDDVDFTARVLATFDRFRRRTPYDYRKDAVAAEVATMSTVEANVLDLVVRLHPDLFAELAAFHAEQRDLVPADVVRLDREVRFYLGYLAYLRPLRDAGVATCLPEVSETRGFVAHEVVDVALAAMVLAGGVRPVANDVRLTGAERILVVSGPNQGGKTTLSRTVGQLHYLAALGCPVPGREVRVFLADRIFTHYERKESIDTGAGKLAEELHRMAAILRRATPDSVIILNEIFTSTTVQDARMLSETVLETITELGALCVWVTFIDELSRHNDTTVSMVSTVTDDNATRTYKLVRAPADGRAYAHAIARKHGLTYEQLTARVAR